MYMLLVRLTKHLAMYYIQCLIKEFGMGSNGEQNKTYQTTNFSKQEILSNHKSVLSSHGISSSDKDNDIPLLCWMPELHNNPYRQRFIAVSSTCSTKPLSRLLTIIISKIQDGLKRYTDTIYSRNGVNQIWILKNSKELLEHLKSKAISKVSSIKTFDFFPRLIQQFPMNN